MSLIKAYKHPIDAFDRLFDSFFENNNKFSEIVTKGNFLSQPNVNIKESKDAFELELAAPGLKREDFNVDVQNDHLTIKVERKQEQEEKVEDYKRREFNYTSFKRSFHLDKTIKVEDISAAYTDGILKVNLPKREEAKQQLRTIEIS
ncbi:MAG: Hsp20/alpha crystallin family protein [Bacteroidota bacterium]